MAYPKWYNVNDDARVWSGHADSHHKQGWMYAGSAILAVEEYQGSVRFETFRQPAGITGPSTDYPELWMRLDELSLLPFEDEDDVADEFDPPVPTGDPGDAALGAAFRLIVNFILGR